MAQVYIYNCTPWVTNVQLNDIVNVPSGPIQAPVAGSGYYPYAAQLPIDLSNNVGIPNSWGKSNRLTVRWSEVDDPNVYSALSDPQQSPSDDLFIWVLFGTLYMSQGNQIQAEVPPDQI